MSQEENPRAAWYAWTYESVRFESPRSRYYFVNYSTYPTNSLWMKDLVLNAADLARFDHEIRSKIFYILMFATKTKARYSLEPVGSFKIRVREGHCEITQANMTGPDTKKMTYEWKYNDDPYNFPVPPTLVPTAPDVTKGPLFPGGVTHLQYPVAIHSSHKHLADRARRFYPARAKLSYGGVSTSGKIHGLPVAPSSSQKQGALIKSRRGSAESSPPV